MDNRTGMPLPFTFGRASSATLFDSNKDMQLVGNDIPRIDFGNYSDSVKLLIEKESTNLVLDNTNILSGYSKSPSTQLESFNWDGVINSPMAANIPYVTSGSTPYFYNSINQIQDILYTYSTFCSVNDSYPIIKADGYADITVNGGFSSLNQESITVGSAPNISYRDNIGRYYSIKRATSSQTQINGIAKSLNSLTDDLYCGGSQIEEGDTMTSYIPTSGSQVTRSADILSISLDNASTVYLKTTKQDTNLNKPSGLWNIHEDLNNEGIEVLAIM